MPFILQYFLRSSLQSLTHLWRDFTATWLLHLLLFCFGFAEAKANVRDTAILFCFFSGWLVVGGFKLFFVAFLWNTAILSSFYRQGSEAQQTTWPKPLCSSAVFWTETRYLLLLLQQLKDEARGLGQRDFLQETASKCRPVNRSSQGKQLQAFLCAQSANTSLQEMSPQTQLLLSALFRGLYTYLLSHGNNSWKTEWEARSTWLSCGSSPIQQRRFSPWGSVIWQKGSIWKHFFIV